MIKNTIKILKILDPDQRKKFKFLIFLMFVTMILETGSIASLLPLINYFSDGNLITNIKIFKTLGIEISNNANLIMFFVMIVFIFKNIFLAFYYYMDSKFIYDVKYALGFTLFKKYLANNYQFHIQNNSSKLKEKITGSTSTYMGALSGLSTLICESLIMIGLLTILFLIKPQETIIIILTGLFLSLLFYYTLRTKIYWLGKRKILADREYIKSMTQGFEAIKDMMIFKSEKEFTKVFKDNCHNKAKVDFTVNFITKLPRIWFEITLLIILMILFLLVSINNNNQGALISTVGIFLAVALRLLPSAYKLIQAIQRMKLGEAAVASLEIDLNTKDFELDKLAGNREINKINFNKKLEFKDVAFTYNNSAKNILNNINLSIKKNNFVAIVGETGSGKSTFIDLIIGLIKPTKGIIEADGISISKNTDSWMSNIGYVPQNIYLTDDTIEKNILFGCEENDIDAKRFESSIKNAQLKSFVASLDKGLKTIVGERAVQISGGERQRIGIARALYRNPDLLLFDESTGALDLETENSFFKTLKELKKTKTIIFVTHRTNKLESFDEVFLIEKQTIKKI